MKIVNFRGNIFMAFKLYLLQVCIQKMVDLIKLHKTFLIILLVLLWAGCEEEAEPIVDDEHLEISEFTFSPSHPTMKEEVSVLFSGCSFFKTTSVVIENKQIGITKHFNSRLNQACNMVNDTIPLGILKKGSYEVTLEIIDLNPLSADSVFHTQTKILTVTNK